METVKKYILDKINKEGSIHMSLIDPEELYNDKKKLSKIIDIVNNSGSSAIMVGGSTIYDRNIIDYVINVIKSQTTLPVIIFPNDITSISQHADAIWFMSLLNSLNPYYITGAQMRAAPVIKKLGLEALSLAYIIVGEGKTVGYMGYAHPIPLDEPKIIIGYSLAAEMMGFDFIYIEAGSGASSAVQGEIIGKVKKYLTKSKIIVGGGIRDQYDAYNLAYNGADIIVTGNILEDDPESLYEIVKGVIKGGKDRISKFSR